MLEFYIPNNLDSQLDAKVLVPSPLTLSMLNNLKALELKLDCKSIDNESIIPLS